MPWRREEALFPVCVWDRTTWGGEEGSGSIWEEPHFHSVLQIQTLTLSTNEVTHTIIILCVCVCVCVRALNVLFCQTPTSNKVIFFFNGLRTFFFFFECTSSLKKQKFMNSYEPSKSSEDTRLTTRLPFLFRVPITGAFPSTLEFVGKGMVLFK